MSHSFSDDPKVDNALKHSVRDGVAYSVMAGAGETYFSAFALLLKASTTQIGLLASLPPLVSSISQLLSAWLSRRTSARRRIILLGALVQALAWIPLIVLPILFSKAAVPILIICIILYHAAGSLVIPQWSSLMGDLVPEQRRGRYFAYRTRFTSISAFIALIIAGLVLHGFKEHHYAMAGFVTIFSVAMFARFVSIYHLQYLVEVHHEKHEKGGLFTPRWWSQLKHSRFFLFSLFFSLMQTAVAIGSPFIAVYMLRDLHFTYIEFMTLSAATVLMQFLTLNTWGHISDTFGNRLILLVTGFAIPFIPLAWLFSTSFVYLFTIQLLSGLIWAGFNLSAGNFLYELIPAPRRATFLAFHNVATNIGIFIGAMLGGFIAPHMPQSFEFAGKSYNLHSNLLVVFFISFLIRSLVAVLFIPRIKEIRTVPPMSVSQLIFRATRFSAVTGLLYEFVSSIKRKSRNKK